MIVVVHFENKVQKVLHDGTSLLFDQKKEIQHVLLELAAKHPDTLLIWCEKRLEKELNIEEIPKLFHHKRMMHSYGCHFYISESIGYVENSPFIKLNRNVQYPTWFMNADVGGIYSDVLLTVGHKFKRSQDFGYFLNSLAKLLMPLGLFCYFSPQLLKIKLPQSFESENYFSLFRFVRQHYKWQWVLFLLIAISYYKRKFPVSAFLSAIFYSRRHLPERILDTIPIHSKLPLDSEHFSYDVVIPTIGRKNYLHQVIKDLASQSLLPQKVIIVEQNPDIGSKSELEGFLQKEWPFKIIHFFIHKIGACHARNLGLKEVAADWVFLADDDIELQKTFFSKVSKFIIQIHSKAITFSCLQKDETEKHLYPLQWSTFGSGCSLVERKAFQDICFDESLEHGYGEDADFGMQLRNKGVDVIYLPEPSILHLKAPMGGFRTKPILQWYKEEIQPKPSPTIMRFYQKHRTVEQQQGYKITLFLNYYWKQPIKNPLKYLKYFKIQWNKSVFWANKLAKQNIDN